MLDTPILLLIFNRTDSTLSVLERIKQVKPKQLFIAADGARAYKDGEIEKCEEVRALVDNAIDWDCEVHKLYREENLGCGLAVSSAITWFFDSVDKGIILEDDTLPDLTFFSYCQSMLHHYENVEPVMHIAGSNLQFGIRRGSYSYYFSKYPMIWGWATWKRAWEKYSYNITDSREKITENIEASVVDKNDSQFFIEQIESVKDKKIDTWDYQWLYTLLKYKGVGAVPQSSLIRNIGFNELATHTSNIPYWYKFLVHKPIYNIKYAPNIEVNGSADEFYMSITLSKPNKTIKYVSVLYKIKTLIQRAI
jgi:hypothetical protein